MAESSDTSTAVILVLSGITTAAFSLNNYTIDAGMVFTRPYFANTIQTAINLLPNVSMSQLLIFICTYSLYNQSAQIQDKDSCSVVLSVILALMMTLGKSFEMNNSLQFLFYLPLSIPFFSSANGIYEVGSCA